MADIPALVRLVEERAAAWRPDWPGWPERVALRPESTVAVVGAGPAGVAAARTLLLGAARAGLPLRVVLLDRGGCQFCGAVITRRARRWLEEVLEMPVPPEVPQRPLRGVVYLNPAGAAGQDLPGGLAVTRADRFGGPGLDRALRTQVAGGLPPAVAGGFRLLRPVRVTRVGPASGGASMRVEYLEGGERFSLAAEAVILACGLKGGRTRGLGRTGLPPGYRPPPALAAGMWQVSLAGAANYLGDRLAILDGLVPGATVAFIPQQGPWLTVASLGRHLTRDELGELFNAPAVRRLVEVAGVEVSPACGGCAASVFRGGAARVAGQGWLAAGDLAGYGRVLKDGYLAAFRSGSLAGRALLERGTEGAGRAYRLELAREGHQNRIGMALFALNGRLAARPWFARWLLGALREEEYARAAVRGLAGGEIPYGWVGLFFLLGLGRRLWKTVRPAGERLVERPGRG